MSDLKTLLQDKLKETRNTLSPSSIRTYVSILSNLYKKMDGEGNVDFFKMKSNYLFVSDSFFVLYILDLLSS